LYNTALASAKVIGEFRKIESLKKDGEIGVILNLTPSYPRSESEEDVKAAKISDAFFNNSFSVRSIESSENSFWILLQIC